MIQERVPQLRNQVTTGQVLTFRQQAAGVVKPIVPLPTSVTITELGGENWKLLRPFVLRYERDTDGSHLMSDSIFLVYGIGDTIDAAVRDYVTSLLEYYEIIAANVTDEATARQFAQIQQYLQHKT